MSFETKEDLQKVCEAILGYQKSLEEIDKYIDRLNRRMRELNEKAAQEQTQHIFAEYSEILDGVQEKCQVCTNPWRRLVRERKAL